MAERLPDGARVEVLDTTPKKYKEYVGRQGEIKLLASGGWYWVKLDPKNDHVMLHLTRREIKPCMPPSEGD